MELRALRLPSPSCPSGCRLKCVRRGSFRRARDCLYIQRYLCRGCGKSFSDATGDLCFGQKKRDLNPIIFRLLTGGFSQRRAAWDLRINRKTVVRKFELLGERALEVLRMTNLSHPPAKAWEFDDLETFEHTKCKPISVIQAVESHSRRILGFRVASAPAKGRLAKIAFKKYGRRLDTRKFARKDLFSELQDLVQPESRIRSDESFHYPADVKRFFPTATYERFRGRQARESGFGELKKGRFDPIFALNHTFAMVRANINRLARRTWCTTKRQDRLNLHLALYAVRHNLDLIKKPRKARKAS